MRGFGSFDAAARFCTAHDELRAPSARAPASTTPSPSPSNAACSRTAGARCARCCRQPNRGRGSSPSDQPRLPHRCVLKPDASPGDLLARLSSRVCKAARPAGHCPPRSQPCPQLRHATRWSRQDWRGGDACHPAQHCDLSYLLLPPMRGTPCALPSDSDHTMRRDDRERSR